MDQKHIRNFAIIAHIDHGKSTLADRLLEVTKTVAMRDMQAQLLDSNPIERERGITIKLAPVRMHYLHNKEEYILNLIDTPGHVDFGYEVSRSMAACEGALLVVDATQGVQAQTLANLHQARASKLTIIPLINKIDMPMARIEETRQELRDLGFDDSEMIEISAKTGINVDKVLEAIVTRVPAPSGKEDAPLRALIFSSQYDTHKGVVVFVRVIDGAIVYKPDVHIHFVASKSTVTPIGVGIFHPQMQEAKSLSTGEVGYIATGLKDVRMAKVGDTVTIVPDEEHIPHVELLPGYKEPKSMVFVGLFPIESNEFQHAREAMEKLQLSDSAFTFRPISSLALGNGFHCGFLGLLHAEIVQERIQREFGLSLLATSPSVEYLLELKHGSSLSKLGFTASSIVHDEEMEKNGNTVVSIQSATAYPDPTVVESVREPIMQVAVYCPKRFVGAVMQLSEEKRGEYIDLVYHGEPSFAEASEGTAGGHHEGQVEMTYLIPLSEMIVDFFDRLKSVTEGYASLDYEFFAYQEVEVSKVDILVNRERVDALAFLIVRDQAHRRGKEIVERLVKVLPRQQFSIPVQAAIGGEVIARDDIKAFRKDVIQKLYGGDRTRKDKLLDKQKKGKAKMKLIGRVEIPQTAFFDVLRNK